jgi:hypothetical protein
MKGKQREVLPLFFSLKKKEGSLAILALTTSLEPQLQLNTGKLKLSFSFFKFSEGYAEWSYSQLKGGFFEI